MPEPESTADPRHEAIVGALRGVHDPEIPVNLYDLGLIYDIAIVGDDVTITMTLTTPNCPVAETLPEEVRLAAAGVDGVASAAISLVFEPAWSPDSMSEDAKLQLEMMGIEWANPMASISAARRHTSLSIGRSAPKRS